MTWDVAVIGGGPAGAVAAYVLAGLGRRVLLVDAADVETRDAPARKVGESLPAIAGFLLGKLGLRAVLDRGHQHAFGNVSAWGGEELVSTDFIRDPHGLGWHLDRTRFDADLRDAARDAGDTLRSSRLLSARRDDGWCLRFGDTSVERAACVIDATGRRAMIARREGAKRIRDDALVALYTWATSQAKERETRTLVESVPEGWWYTAPLPDGTRVVALHVDADVARAILRAQRGHQTSWEAHLARTRHVREALSGCSFVAPPRVSEASGARLDRFVGAGWVATGDTALSFDPIAAQGIFNALYTGMKAGQAVGAALGGDPRDLGDYSRRLEEIRAAYCARHAYIHDGERRWPESPFWKRRLELSTVAAAG